MSSLLERFENNTVFTDSEGWMLFRIGAITEAVGWTLLITGIGLSRYVFSNNQFPIQFAGRIHGMLFLVYVVAAIGLYPTLRWSRTKALVAVLASVPPYGSLLFELWASNERNNKQYHICRSCIALQLLAS